MDSARQSARQTLKDIESSNFVWGVFSLANWQRSGLIATEDINPIDYHERSIV